MSTETIPPNRRILIIDDNESIHQDFRKILDPATQGRTALASAAAEIFGDVAGERTEANFEIDSAFQGQEGLEKVQRASAEARPYAMAFVDLRMPPGWDGIETISRIWEVDPGIQVVICTAYSDYSLDQMVARLGRSDRMLILKKPFDAIEILQFADALTEKWRLGREAQAKVDDLEARVAERTRELREGQQQLVEARKMELVGKLAAGIAHDFNSLLTAIIGHADLIRTASTEGQVPFRSAVEIAECAVRAAALTHQLLGFGRRQVLKIEPLDVNALLKEMEPIFRQMPGGGIEVTVAPNARNGLAKADSGQLRKVLVTLANNARDAMPRGGKLVVESADVTAGGTDPELIPGDYVMIKVTDTGCGISEDAKPHIFEPYFTTRTAGAGKGLGLAMSHGILKQTGGHISFESKAGCGAAFKIFLPRFQGPEDAEAAPRPAAVTATRGAGVILLAEGDGALRVMTAIFLEKQGYQVYAAGTCREAIAISGRVTRVDLLVIDAAMPEMSGPELAQWLCSLHPRMKVLFTATGDEQKAATAGSDYPLGEFIRKPYAPDLLADKVRAALEGVVSAAGVAGEAG